MGSNGDRSRFALPGNHLGSLWFIEGNNQNNHPYLLDWYYTDVTSRDAPTDHQIDESEHHSRDWMPSNLAHDEPVYDEYMNEYCDDRAASHVGASTSAPIFKESLIQDRNSDDLRHPTRSHWWARSHSQGGRGQTSFFEPPNFNDQRADNHYDKFSDIGSEDQEQEQHLYWRDHHKLSSTVHTDDLEAGEFNLHFDDIYNRHPENLTENSNTASF